MRTRIVYPKIKSKQPRGRPYLTIPHFIDWNLRNTRIAQIYGVSTMTVMKWRKELGRPPLPRGRPFMEEV